MRQGGTMVVQLTVTELEDRIRSAVREAIGDRSEREWLTRDQAAEALGVTTKTVSSYVERGELKAHRLGRLLRFKREDLDAFVASEPKKAKRRG